MADNRQSSHQPPARLSFASLPKELRIEIWHCAIQPQLVFLHEVLERPSDFALPAVLQVNREAREECRYSFNRFGQGLYFQFAKDIFICDRGTPEKPSNFLDSLALKVQRLAFWDCFPDDLGIADLSSYKSNLWSSFGRKIADPIDFGNLWFPNLKELWVIKIGDVDASWGPLRDKSASPLVQFKQLARQFRYWVEDGVLEIASLDLTDSDTKHLLQNGRCSENSCRWINYQRPMMVSRVIIMDTPYHERVPNADTTWVTIKPEQGPPAQDADYVKAQTNWLRWALVERVLYFMLSSYYLCSDENVATAPVRTRTIGSV